MENVLDYSTSNYTNIFDRLKKVDLKSLSKDELIKLKSKLEEYSNFWDIKNNVYKVNVINSLYGILDKEESPVHNPKNAEAVSSGSQFCVRSVKDRIQKELGDEVDCFYNDTDSVFTQLKTIPDNPDSKKLAQSMLAYSKDKVVPIIKSNFVDMAKFFNVENLIKMEVDEICDQMIMHSPKQYIGRYIYKDGKFYDKKDYKYKIKGVSIVRRDSPIWVRQKLEDALKIIFDGTNKDMWDYIDIAKKEFMELDLRKVGKPMSVSDMEKYKMTDIPMLSINDDDEDDDFDSTYIDSEFKKGTPRQTKSALLYNKFIIENKLEQTHQLLYSGSKIVYVYLKKTASQKLGLDSMAINVHDTIPAMLYDIIKDEIDYDKMWDKVFKSKMKFIMEDVGWTFERIDDFLDNL